MFTPLYLNDSFMIRKIIVAAVPAALVAVGMSLALSEPASSQMSSGGVGGATNTNQVYPNNQRGGMLNPGTLQLSTGGGGSGYGSTGRYGRNFFFNSNQQFGVSSGANRGAGRG